MGDGISELKLSDHKYYFRSWDIDFDLTFIRVPLIHSYVLNPNILTLQILNVTLNLLHLLWKSISTKKYVEGKV